MSKLLTPQATKAIFNALTQHIPNPTTELIYTSNFELLIAVILSAQATDVSVNKATKNLFKVANTPEQILALDIAKLTEYIKFIGLFNSKASNILKTCAILKEKHSSLVPDNRQALEALPGVGRKTANVILNTAFGQHTIAVDTHVFRVSKRIGLSTKKTPLQVEQDLMLKVPTEYLKDAHHLLILHGRYTCTAKTPKCNTCVINPWCLYHDKK